MMIEKGGQVEDTLRQELEKLREDLQRSFNRVEKLIKLLADGPVEKEEGIPRGVVLDVFQYWVTTVRGGRKGIKLSPERERKIRKALENYGFDDVILAIDGVLLSSFHMGDNPDNKPFNDIELILRNGVNIEKFRDLTLDAATRQADPF